ncbi:TetR/AcrR family transcriptional regulator [Microvirga massiliensis]|uniref:TetR/AcrR family transcriptional regulator n=1 Tax=Microvirga massiliensis TaxID=1033741 RepID=UPI00062BAFED|nr:TetR/AcrR family transcriptional regulator [Microvirga massiliensis]
MTTTRRGRGRPARTEAPKRDDILLAALSAFARAGYEGTNLRQIADDAGVDVALVAHHFGSKLDLWKATVDHLAERVLAATRDTAAAGNWTDLRERVRSALCRHIELNSAMPELAMFVAQEVLPATERSDYVYEHLVRPHHDLMLPIIREAISAGVIREQDPELFFFLFVTSVSMTIAIQPLMARFTETAASRDALRAALQAAVTANVLGSQPAALD